MLLDRFGVASLGPDAILESTVSPNGVELADSGLGGWLPVLAACLGGCGKAPMLTVFRSDFPGGSGPAGELSEVRVGTLEVELVCPRAGRCGNTEDDTARLPVAGEGSSDADEVRDAGLTLETRDLATGSEGRGPVGGAIEGRDGRGSVVVAMVLLVEFGVVVSGAIVRRSLRRRSKSTGWFLGGPMPPQSCPPGLLDLVAVGGILGSRVQNWRYQKRQRQVCSTQLGT